MDEKDYELLSELYHVKNITKVAQKLFLTQPAITKRIQKMEKELQSQLLLRSKKGVVFTPAGERIIPYALEILKNSRMLREQAASCHDEICGTLRLGSSLNFSHYYLPSILKTYTEKYPRVDVQIETGQSRNLYQLLQTDNISIAVLRGEFTWDDGMFQLASEPMCFVCNKENKDRPLTDFPYIGRNTDSALADEIQTWMASQGLKGLQPKLHIDDIGSCVEMVRYGLGWCILPKICVKDFDGYVKELFFDNGKPFVRNTYVLYRKPFDQLPQVKLFLRQLVESIKSL